MASLINPPLLDKTGKEILAALTGEEVQPSASQYNAPISDATGKAILEAIKQGGGGGSGGSGGAFYVGMTVDGGGAYVLDKTWQEIADAIIAKTPAYITVSDTVNDYYALWPINGVGGNVGNYYVDFSTDSGGGGPSGATYLETSTKNGYPKYVPD